VLAKKYTEMTVADQTNGAVIRPYLHVEKESLRMSDIDSYHENGAGNRPR
jgi:hypothetical protein